MKMNLNQIEEEKISVITQIVMPEICVPIEMEMYAKFCAVHYFNAIIYKIFVVKDRSEMTTVLRGVLCPPKGRTIYSSNKKNPYHMLHQEFNFSVRKPTARQFEIPFLCIVTLSKG